MLGRGKRDRELDDAIRELAEADTLAFGGVGFAGQTLPPTAAYEALERLLPDRAEELRERLTTILADGSPAGKAYAASLLGRFDAAAARAAWESLTEDRGELTTFVGCVMGRTTLGEYARDRLRPDED
ncbi:hypothetical protein ACFFWC_04510 [Plantactinospora siamensis]|uniref:Uncharacterized protein n=1 Tax=Plantactinospora siamensis TaxID=555372 RepID=A0ABV6NSM0_9ACTN